jgi:hypothetical protein
MFHHHIFRCSFCLCFFISLRAFSDNDTAAKIKFKVEGFAETYYVYDFTAPDAEIRPEFYYNHDRVNKPALNIGMLQFSAEKNRFKSALGFMTGSYVSANLADESPWFKNVYEANLSYQLHKRKHLWLQAGIFNSHIGFESAIAADCYTLTRSVAADNSPYYETGVRINYKTKSEKWEYHLLLLNGWQQMPDFNRKFRPALGFRVQYIKGKYNFNYSNYLGNEGTSGAALWRFFNNIYVTIKPLKKMMLIVGLDAGYQYKVVTSKNQLWYAPQVVMQYRLLKKLDIACRIERYTDKYAAATIPYNNAYLNMMSGSFNIDYKFLKGFMLRAEVKQLNNASPIFYTNKGLSSHNLSAAASLCMRF